MAIMYPDRPKEIDEKSGEDMMFRILERLPNSYYVFHSFRIVTVKSGKIYESETDFVIYNQEKGILCLEAKNGQVSCKEGYWRYGSGIIMDHDGPYSQAAHNKWKLYKYMTESLGLWSLADRVKMIHGVWFPAIKRKRLSEITLPADSDIHLTLTREAEDDIEGAISKLFDYKLPNMMKTSLTDKDTEVLINNVFAPEFNLVSIAEMNQGNNERIFKVMQREQLALLNYLDEQNSAVINGMAGTGKTVMAANKALKHANRGEHVLFLCYNSKLKEHLQVAYSHEYIHFYTIDGLACKMCNTKEPNYGLLEQTLSDMYGGSFPYQHVIIDEGQDFERADEKNIINLLRMNVLDDETKGGTFYLFYDKNQMVQSKKAPAYIDEADCRLTLYRNCRNTINIATTSLRLLGSEKKPKLVEGAVEGDSPEFYVTTDLEETVHVINKVIDQLREIGIENIQILTCKTEDTSIITPECSTGVYVYNRGKIPFTTCRKFKGLEADAVIMVDMEKDILSKNGDDLLYVGASRAKYKLIMIGNLSNDDCNEVVNALNLKASKKPGKALAAAYNAKLRNVL